MLEDIECTEVGEIGNYYGGLNIKRTSSASYWVIEKHNGIEEEDWCEISSALFDELMKEKQ